MESFGAVGARPELELRPPVPAWTTERSDRPLSLLTDTPVRNGAWAEPYKPSGLCTSIVYRHVLISEDHLVSTSLEAMQQKLHREPKACTGAAPLLGSGHVRLVKTMP